MFDEEITCDEIMRKDGLGVLDIAIDKKRNQLTTEGFDVSKHEVNGKLLSLCTYCGKDNSKLGVILSTIMVIIGLLLIGRAHRMQEKIGPWDS